MSFTIDFSKRTTMPWQPAGNMLKSTREKMQRQAERDGKIDFFEKQKENLKNQEAQTVEEIAEKLDKFHTYEDEIAAAKQEYNSSQMFHVLDEAEERAEKMAKAAEKNKPKTEEERKDDALDEALGTDENKGVLSEIMDKLSETTDQLDEKQLSEITDQSKEKLSEITYQSGEQLSEIADPSAEKLPEATQQLDEKQLSETTDKLETELSEKQQTAEKRYHPFDARV